MRPLYRDPNLASYDLPGMVLPGSLPLANLDNPVYLLGGQPKPKDCETLAETLTRQFLFVAALRRLEQPALVILLVDEDGLIGEGEPLTAALAVATDSFARSMAMECGRKEIFFHTVVIPQTPNYQDLADLLEYLAAAGSRQTGGRFWLRPQTTLGRMLP